MTMSDSVPTDVHFIDTNYNNYNSSIRLNSGIDAVINFPQRYYLNSLYYNARLRLYWQTVKERNLFFGIGMVDMHELR